MCGVSCCVERRRGGYARRSVHIRMPDAMRKFKLTNMAKEGLLHSMIHAYLFMTGAVKEHEPFYEHGPQFRHMMRRLNNDTLTFDAFRPSGGYEIIFSFRRRGCGARSPAGAGDARSDHPGAL